MSGLSSGAAGGVGIGERDKGKGGKAAREGRGSFRWPYPGISVFIFSLLIFAPVLSFNFVRYDDPDHIYQNPAYNPPTWGKISRFWVNPYQSIYMPVTYTVWGGCAELSWRGNGGMNPFLFHLANLLAYAVSGVLVFAILLEMGFARMASMLGGLIFAVHPVHVESVAWATDLKDVLSGMLALAALWFYLRSWGRRGWWYAAATILFVLALLAKPSVAVLPVIAGILDWGYFGRTVWRIAGGLAVWVVLAVIALLIARGAQPAMVHPSLFARIGVAGDAAAFYLGHALAPIWIGVDYGRSPRWLMQQPIFYVNWMIPVAVALMIWRYGSKVVAVGAVIFGVALLPVLGLSPFDFQQHSTVADRYLYLSILGLSMIAAAAVQRWPRWGMGIVVGVAVLYGYKTLRHEWVWRDTRSLFAQALEVNPDSDLGNNAMGIIYADESMASFDAKKIEQSVAYFRRAVASNPISAGEHANLATALLMAGNRQKAEEEVRIVKQLKPGTKRMQQMDELLSGKAQGFSMDNGSQ